MLISSSLPLENPYDAETDRFPQTMINVVASQWDYHNNEMLSKFLPTRSQSLVGPEFLSRVM